MILCDPVKNGWQEEHTSTRMSSLKVERVTSSQPQLQVTLISLYFGCIPDFTGCGPVQQRERGGSITEWRPLFNPAGPAGGARIIA